MTYYEAYKNVKTESDLIAMMQRDAIVAVMMLGGNPDRIKAIEDAGNRVSDERGWTWESCDE